MKFLKISVENFNGVAARVIDLEVIPYATVVGSNGAGKSTLFVDAPLFALFGRSAVREDLASVVMRGQETALVDFTFELGEETIRVQRTYSIRTKAGAQSLDVWRDGVQVNGATMTETQKLLDTIVGCSFDVMVMGSIMRQGESDRFASATPAERLRLLGALLGAERYRDAKTEAAQQLRDAEGSIRSDVSRLAEMQELGPQLVELVDVQASLAIDLEKKSAEHSAEAEKRQALVDELAQPVEGFSGADDLEKMRADLDALIGKHRDKLQKANEQNREIDQIMAQRETLKQLSARDQDALEAFRAKRPDPSKLAEIGERGKSIAQVATSSAAEFAELTAKVEDFHQRQAEHRRVFAGLNAQVAPLSLRPDECKMDHCGLIRSAVAAKAELDALTLDPYDGDLEKDAAAIIQLAKTVKESEAAVEAARAEYLALKNELKGFDARVLELEAAAKQSVKNLTEGPIALKSPVDVTKLREAFDDAEKGIKEKIDELGKEASAHLAKLAYERQAIQSHIKAVDAVINELALSIRDLERRIAGGNARRVEIEKGIAKAEEITGRVAVAQEQINLLNHAVKFLAVAPQIVVEQALPVIESVANEVLEQIQPGATIEVRQSRETKAGAVKDEIGVMCIADGYEAPLATFSGGERFRIDLALRLGIAAASGAKLETLIIDEGWGSQDADKLEQVKEAIAALTERFPRIYTISHVLAIEDMFGSIIRV